MLAMSRLIPTVSPFYDPTTSTFSYVVADPTTSVAAIIDPVLDYNAITRDTATHSARKLLDFIVLRGLKVQWILETHAHADHLSSAQWLKEQLSGQPRVGIGAGIRQVQETFKARLSLEAGFPVDGSQFDVLFEDGDRVTLGSIPLEVIATPGHTPDSVTYLIGDAAFVGDTIFAPSYGTARSSRSQVGSRRELPWGIAQSASLACCAGERRRTRCASTGCNGHGRGPGAS